MNPYVQIALTILSGVLIAAITSWISVRLALKQFYSQKWWERKEEAYSHIIEALYHVRHILKIQLNADEVGIEIKKEQMEVLTKKIRESYDEINKAEGIGAFIISNKAAQILTELSHDLDALDNLVSYYEYLDNSLFSVNKCLGMLRDEAKRDLKIG